MQGVHFRKHQIGGLSSVVGSYDFKYLNSLQLKAVTTMCQVYATNESKNFVGQEHFLSFLSGFSPNFSPKRWSSSHPRSRLSVQCSSQLIAHTASKISILWHFSHKKIRSCFLCSPDNVYQVLDCSWVSLCRLPQWEQAVSGAGLVLKQIIL